MPDFKGPIVYGIFCFLLAASFLGLFHHYRKKTSASRFYSDHLLRSIIESLPIGFNTYTLKPDDRLILTGTNRAAATILKKELSAEIGKTFEEITKIIAVTARDM